MNLAALIAPSVRKVPYSDIAKIKQRVVPHVLD